jgi:hypothetical protein
VGVDASDGRKDAEEWLARGCLSGSGRRECDWNGTPLSRRAATLTSPGAVTRPLKALPALRHKGHPVPPRTQPHPQTIHSARPSPPVAITDDGHFQCTKERSTGWGGTGRWQVGDWLSLPPLQTHIPAPGLISAPTGHHNQSPHGDPHQQANWVILHEVRPEEARSRSASLNRCA